MARSGRLRIGLYVACLLLVGVGAAHYATALSPARKHPRVSNVVLPLPGTPDLANLQSRLGAKGLTVGNPVFVRIFKEEAELEVWMDSGNGFVLLDTYPICNSSGLLGPKLREGDRQNPEGFYSVTARQLHGGGRWPRSLNIGFPNGFDRSLKRTGSYILIHGGCSSTGCFAMTNPVMQEIYFLTDSALKGGQHRIQIHVFPFRMSEANMRAHAESRWLEFWQNLKQGYDAFDATQIPPRIGMCGDRYLIEPQKPGQNGAAALAACADDAGAIELHPADTAESQFDDLPEPAVSTRSFRTSHAMKLRARRAKVAARAKTKALANSRKSPRVSASCNAALPSCRKFVALKQQSTRRSRVASAGSGTRER